MRSQQKQLVFLLPEWSQIVGFSMAPLCCWSGLCGYEVEWVRFAAGKAHFHYFHFLLCDYCLSKQCLYFPVFLVCYREHGLQKRVHWPKTAQDKQDGLQTERRQAFWSEQAVTVGQRLSLQAVMSQLLTHQELQQAVPVQLLFVSSAGNK